jgi:hypothetical protein
MVGPCEQRQPRRRIVARGRDLRLSPDERAYVMAHRRIVIAWIIHDVRAMAAAR